MQLRTFTTALVLPLLALAACDADGTTGIIGGSENNVTVRVANATATSLDIATNGTVATGNGALSFGTSSTCMVVDATNPGIAARETGTATALPGLAPTFVAGGNYTVVAYPGTGATTQFATVANAFTPTAGQGGLRVLNLATIGSNYDVHVTAPGATLGAPSVNNVAYGTGSSFFNVGATGVLQIRITNAGSQAVVLDVGNHSFSAARNETLVIAPPAAGTTTLRAFRVQGC